MAEESSSDLSIPKSIKSKGLRKQNRPSVVSTLGQDTGEGAFAPKQRKPLVSPTSSFVDFADLETEIITEQDRANEHLYNPFEHRHLKKPTTDFETAVHLLKGSVGAGLLAMPKAFCHAGIALAIPGTFILGILCVYGIHVMLKMQYLQLKWLRVPFLTLPRSLKIALLNGPPCLRKLAPLAPCFVDFVLVANQVGLCATFVTFISTSLKNVLEPSVTKEMDVRIYMGAIFLPILVVNYIRNLKRLMPISLLGDVLIFSALGCCFYYILGTGPFKLDEVKLVSSPATWPLFLGTVMFALEAVGVMITLEHNMAKPQHFLGWRGIFPWCMALVILLYAAVGLFSYLKYGQSTQDTIVSSLPRGETLASMVQVMIALAIYGSYPLQLFVGLEIIWGNYVHHYISDPNKECVAEYIMRTTVVIITFLLAMVIPHVDLVISLVGAFCLSILGLVIPFLMEMCTLWPDRLGPWRCVLIKDVLLILMGLCILLVGTYTALYTIIAK